MREWVAVAATGAAATTASMTTSGRSISMWWLVCSTDTTCETVDRSAQRCWPWFHAAVRRASSEAPRSANCRSTAVITVIGSEPSAAMPATSSNEPKTSRCSALAVGSVHPAQVASMSGGHARAVVGDRAELGRPRGRAGVDEHEARHLVGVAGGERDCLGTTEGVADDHVRSRLADRGEQGAELRRLRGECLRRCGRVAGAGPGPGVRADAGPCGDVGFDLAPVLVADLEAGDQQHRGVAAADAADVHANTVDVDQFVEHRRRPGCRRRGDGGAGRGGAGTGGALVGGRRSPCWSGEAWRREVGALAGTLVVAGAGALVRAASVAVSAPQAAMLIRAAPSAATPRLRCRVRGRRLVGTLVEGVVSVRFMDACSLVARWMSGDWHVAAHGARSS